MDQPNKWKNLDLTQIADELYNEMCIDLFIRTHDVKNLTDEEQDEILDLWDNKKNYTYVNDVL